MSNPVGNFLVSLGCLLMLIPVLFGLIILAGAVLGALFGG